jgi:hypothetical protein
VGPGSLAHGLDPDILVVLFLPAGGMGEARRRPGGDLHPCLAVHDLDTPHFLARDMTAAA